MKDDPLSYATFVEGITLLAWDIAWMCKTQGLEIGRSSWEDVCAMGKNLWQLLLGPPPSFRRQPTERDSPAPATARTPLATAEAVQKPSPPNLGHFSHGTAHSFLSASEGVDYMNGWRLQSPVKVIDRVKAMLLSERDGAEWQILEENEWEEGDAPNEPGRDEADKGTTGEETVLIEGMANDVETLGSGNNLVNEAIQKSEEDQERAKGTSGWTKLKSRGGS